MCKDRLLIRDDVLHYQWLKNPDKILCVVVPTSPRPQVLNLWHDVKSAGHLGIEKTLANLKSAAYWPNMTVKSYDYAKLCLICNLAKKKTTKTARLL